MSFNILLEAGSAFMQEEDIDAAIQFLEAYSNEMTNCLSAIETSTDQKLLEEVAALHDRVLNKAEKLKSGASKDLQAYRKHGKGIMAYTDILPKRISFNRSKKG